MLKLRIRSPTGVSDITVDPTVSLAALKLQLDASALRTGFPPRPLTAPDATPLKDLLRNGDLIVVQTQTKAPPQSTSVSAPVSTPVSTQPSVAPVSTAPPASSIASQGKFQVRQVPDDNSCLFRSVSHLLGGAETVSSLRRIVANRVLSSPAEFSEAVLGRTPAAYAQWITTDNAWGGAIELSILAAHARVQFAAFDVHTMRLDRYPHDARFESIAYLVYNGIHYNYVALVVPGIGDVMQFQPTDEYVMAGVRKLAQDLHDSRQYTDTASFTLVCKQCNTKLTGERQALEHANTTGHTQFDEN